MHDRRTRFLSVSLAAFAFAGTTASLGPRWIERHGTKFFQAGRTAEQMLDQAARALEKGDIAAFTTSLAPDYRGSDLGLRTLQQTRRFDDAVVYRMASRDQVHDRAAAVDEWCGYRAQFSHVSEVRLAVHRVESWMQDGQMQAVLRFEWIGKLRTASHESIDRAYLNASLRSVDGQIRLTSLKLREGTRVINEGAVQFRDVAAQAGVDFSNRYYPAFLDQPLKFGMIRYGPGGITAVDYDQDGRVDLFIPDGVESKLLRNRGDGTFEDVTARSGLSGLDGVSVAVFADYDNDGHRDLFVSRTFRPNQLFHANGDGTFTDVTERSGLQEDCCTTVAAWADYDNDGDLDLYVGRYLDPRQDLPTTFYARNGEPNRLYRNNGNGTFADVTEKAGVGEKGLCLGVVWGDYNDDGWPDLYVVNDFGRKTLYRNKGDGTFADVTVASNTLAYGAGMSASFGDYDNDGRLDIYVANIRSESAWFAEAPTVMRYMSNSWRQGVWKTDMPLYLQIFRQSGLQFVQVFQQMASGNTLLRNQGDGSFDDVTWHAEANPVGWFWGSVFGDFDNDGWQDIYSADGWVYNDRRTEIEPDFLNNVVGRQDEYKKGVFFDPKNFGRNSWHGWERNRHLRNRGDGTFDEIGRAADTDLMLNSRGVAVADFWNRGVLDIAVAASDDRHALLRNQMDGRRNWLEVELTGTRSNRDAIGARIILTIQRRRFTREVTAGDSYASQSMHRQHFGLGHVGTVDKLEVRWPRTGTVQTFENVAARRIVRIIEGSGELAQLKVERGR